MERQELHELLIKAKEIQVQQGRTRHMLVDGLGHVCPTGAIIAAFVGGMPAYLDIRRKGTYKVPNEQLLQWREVRDQCARRMGFASRYALIEANDRADSTDERVLAWFDRGIEATAPK